MNLLSKWSIYHLITEEIGILKTRDLNSQCEWNSKVASTPCDSITG